MAVDRHQDMGATIGRVKEEFVQFQGLGGDLSRSAWVTELLRKKLAGSPIRAYYLAKVAAWLKTVSPWRSAWTYNRQERLFTAQLPFIFEVVITIQYLHNQILDGKSGVTDRRAVARNVLAANLLKEQLYRYIDTRLPLRAREATLRAVRRCFEQTDHGQYLEQAFNTYPAFVEGHDDWQAHLPDRFSAEVDLSPVEPFLTKLKADLPTMLHAQLDVYFARIYLTCAGLFVEASRLVGELLYVPATKLRAVSRFSLCYGLMRQLVNDNADWVPSDYGLTTNTKTSADQFSDLRNGTLTLPLIFHFAERKTGALTDLLQASTTWSPNHEKAVFEDILHSDALFKSIQNTRILSELALAYLPLDNQEAGFLADSCEIVHWNKFLKPCLTHPAYAAYRRGSYRRRTRRLILQLRRARTADPVSAPAWWQAKQDVTAELPPPVSHTEALLRAYRCQA